MAKEDLEGMAMLPGSTIPDDYLKWIAFFQHSNPFLEVYLDSGRINAVNNHRHVWSFNIENQIDIEIH